VIKQAQENARSCPVCGAGNARPWLEKEELRLVRCVACSMIYASPVPTEMASAAYYEQAGRDYYLSPAKLEGDYAAVRFERELRVFRKYCSSGSVLDVGCSSGAFLHQLKTRWRGAYDVLGTDASGPALDFAESKGIPVLRGNFTRQDFGGKTFEAVTFWAVLEHLAEPASFLQKASTLMKPGGVCFVLVPNLRSLAVRFLGGHYRYIYPQHLNYFATSTLKQLVARYFSLVELRSTHFNPVVIWQDWRRGGGPVSNTERAALLQRTTAWKQSGMLAWFKPAYGLAEKTLGALRLADNLVAVLRKADP